VDIDTLPAADKIALAADTTAPPAATTAPVADGPAVGEERAALEVDSRFFRAIAYGSVAGVPFLWVVLTIVFLVLTNQSVSTVVGFSALPAVFCGPFLGGLVTTSLVHTHGTGQK
jgi:hypothetical protein